MSKIQLYQGDCLEIMQQLINQQIKVDAIITDPPYGTTACKWDSIIPFESMWNCINSLSKDTTPIILFGQEPFSSKLRLSNINNYKYDWIWIKNKPSGFSNAKYKPMCNHEIISVFCKEMHTYNPIKEPRDLKERYINLTQGFTRNGNYGSNTQKTKSENTPKQYDALRYPTTVKKFDVVPNNKGSRLHPTQKPIELMEYLIKTYSNEGDTILDFTMGSGTTGVACQSLNRNFIGIELDPTYYEISCKRLHYTM